jgi:hypothetical protein
VNLLAALVVLVAAAAVVWTLLLVVAALRRLQEQLRQAQTLRLLAAFTPGIAAAAVDPRALLSWQPLALSGRSIFPDEFAALDRATGGTFPFSTAQIEQAHSRWTADWLAWEQAHDNTYKLKAAQAAAALSASGGSSVHRAEVEAVEREKLERYQARYGEYVKVAKGLQALMLPPK